jgi:hypothetical protein
LKNIVSSGRNASLSRGIGKYSTAAAVENPISPPVSVNYNQLLIDGKFVNAASGEISQHSFTRWYICNTYFQPLIFWATWYTQTHYTVI